MHIIPSYNIFSSNPKPLNNDSGRMFLKEPALDIFIKSPSNTTFTSSKEDNDILSNLAAIGIIGGPFLLSIAAATYKVRKENPQDLFLPDGTYFMNTKEMNISSHNLNADYDDGIFKIAGTGIDIKPERFDYINPEEGIFRSFSTKIDIDLKNNKYIDPEKGIFIDPEKELSAINIDGELKNIIIPNFSSDKFSFGRLYTDSQKYNPNVGFSNMNSELIPRSEFLNRYGITPEEYFQKNNVIPTGTNFYVGKKLISIMPDDKRTILEKMMHFYDPNKHAAPKHDIFGREIITIVNNAGIKHEIALNDDLRNIIYNKNLTLSDLNKIFNYTENLKLDNYITQKFPQLCSYLPHISMNDFFEDLGNKTSIDTTEVQDLIEKSADILSDSLDEKISLTDFIDIITDNI